MRKLIALALLLTLGCSDGSEQAQRQATEAFKQFGGQLKQELQTALESGGPVQAIEVCRERAPQIAEQQPLEMGRSSHGLRNPDNKPDPGVADYLQRHANAAEAPVETMAAGDHWLVIAPIETQPMCLTCHGDPVTFTPELKAALAENYPEDQATGFKAGDLRGVFWAKVPRR